MRFGVLNAFDGNSEDIQYAFSYELIKEDSSFTGIHQRRPDNQALDKAYFSLFWDKIMGR